MNNAVTSLTTSDIISALAIGIILSLLYFYLLWQTISILPRVKKKGLLLFSSGALRIFLLIFVALAFAADNPARFLLIFIGFILTRIILLKIAKPSFKKQIAGNEILQSTPKGSKSSKKTTRKKKK